MRKPFILTSVLVLLTGITTDAWSHGGGVDKQGCHTNGQTGEHHCHVAQPAKPRKSTTNKIIEIPASNTSSFVSGNNKLTIAIQKELVRLGYMPGNIVGIADPKTIMAIKFFQEDIKLEPTGKRNQELLRLMQSYEP